MFKAEKVFPNITHITDAMGVSFTLLDGAECAVLFDTGYGMENVRAYAETLTDRPVTVLLSHGHHDHMLGARWFGKTFLCRDDMDEFRERTGKLQRSKVMKQAADCGVPVPADFLEVEIRMPEEIRFTEKTGGFDSFREDLGGIHIEVVRVPGHTPGSIVVYAEEYGLLLTGDDWNPCTWMWFPSSLDARKWRDNMKKLIRTLEGEGKEVRKVLCSHQPAVREGKELKEFLEYMTDERMNCAPQVDMGAPINTHQIVKDGWTLIFDMDKTRL